MGARRQVLAVLVGVLAAAAAVSCSSSDEAGTATASVGPLLERAATAMAEVDHVAFAIERTGADVAIDGAGRLLFDAAEGRYAAPASADALLEVRAMGLRTRIGAVAIEGDVWITNPLSGRWEAAPPGLSFDPAVLFDARTGWPALLADGLRDPVLVGRGPDDQGRHHVRGTVDGARVAALTGGLVAEPTEVELWIDDETGHVLECRFEVGSGDEVSRWSLVLDRYGEPVTIDPPQPGTTG